MLELEPAPTSEPVHIEPPPPGQSARLTLTADELAALLGVDRKTVYEAAARGQIPSVRLGRRVLFSRAAIDAWLTTSAPAHAMMPEPTRVTGKLVTQ